MTRKIFSTLILAALTTLLGCYPGGPEYVEQYDIVYSNYDPTYDFVSKGTYSLPDKIVKITGKENDPPTYVKDIYAVPMLQKIDANMASLGWTKVDVSKNPDVQFLPAAWESTTIVYWGGGYWCWYYPYYCGGGWYYPYYPSYSSYSTGTLLMNMVDPALESADGNKRVIWTGAINGLLSGTYSTTRVNNAIDQTFKQSPYLKTN